MSSGTIMQAKRDESDKGIVELEHGTFHRWLVSIDVDGGETVETDILRKPESPDPTGESVEQKSNGRWKVGQVQGSGFSGGGKAGKDFKADPVKLRSENVRSALHAAKDLVVADKLPLDKLGEYTSLFYTAIENKAKVDE